MRYGLLFTVAAVVAAANALTQLMPLAFNLADVALLCGEVLMITVVLRPRTARTQAAVTP